MSKKLDEAEKTLDIALDTLYASVYSGANLECKPWREFAASLTEVVRIAINRLDEHEKELGHGPPEWLQHVNAMRRKWEVVRTPVGSDK